MARQRSDKGCGWRGSGRRLDTQAKVIDGRLVKEVVRLPGLELLSLEESGHRAAAAARQ